MAVFLHKWEFKNIEVEFLKVNEKNWSPGLPDIGARKSWDFLILTVSASTVKYFLQSFSLQLRFKKSNCQFLAKECAQYWLSDLTVKMWLGKQTMLYMTPLGWLGHKTLTQTIIRSENNCENLFRGWICLPHLFKRLLCTSDRFFTPDVSIYHVTNYTTCLLSIFSWW